ncbi:unnamed protein product [Soboliphyme baturini]|uniref:SLC12 domain-containing protein n=1 Tax=Soboliphyme baturini TaxID=241478 RepID=A0A183IIJ1_9BILA|nr:unnamed protein product [Soboliphyme baturini]
MDRHRSHRSLKHQAHELANAAYCNPTLNQPSNAALERIQSCESCWSLDAFDDIPESRKPSSTVDETEEKKQRAGNVTFAQCSEIFAADPTAPLADDNKTSVQNANENASAENIDIFAALDKNKVRKMNTAVLLNQAIRQRSSTSRLVVINLPRPPTGAEGLADYMQYLEVLTEGLPRVLLVRGSGKEVITIYS